MVLALRNKKKNYFTALIKSAGRIKKLVDKNSHLFLNNKTIAKMWTIFKDCFQYIFSIKVICIFFDTCNIKLLDCKNIVNYTSHYQIAFDKIFSLINENKDSWISKKIIKIIFQKNFLKHFAKNYSVLVLKIGIM